MAAQVAEVASAVAAQQPEVDDHPATGKIVIFAGGLARKRGLVFCFVVG
jgi:hypothetical protein